MVGLAEVLGIVVALLTILGAIDAFYTKRLPKWMRRMVGFYELQNDLENVAENTEHLEAQHEQTMAEITTLKHGQVALAEAVENEHNTVAVEELREAHFGDREQPGDFLRGDSPYGDD